MKHLIGFIVFFGSWGVVGWISENGMFLCRLPFALFFPMILFGMLIWLLVLCGSFELMVKGRVFPIEEGETE